MKKRKKLPSEHELLLELLKRNAHTQAHLETLFMMQCELFAYLNKSDSKPIVEQWGDARMEFLKQNLDDLGEHLRELANPR